MDEWIPHHFPPLLQIKQQIAKEYDQIKDIQRTLSEMSLDLQNSQFASKLKTTHYNDDEAKDPSLWFRPDPDIWTPPPKDPDVWAPPKIEKFVNYKRKYDLYCFGIKSISIFSSSWPKLDQI